MELKLIKIRVLSLGIVFPTVLRTPLDLHVDVVFGCLGATILSLGCPWRPLEPLLELSWAPVGLIGRPLGLSKGLWVGLVLTL